MNLFFDTSALVKFFHEEDGTQRVTDLINSDENEIWLLEVAGLEFLSALYRRFRNKEIGEDNLNEAISSFEEQLNSFNIQPIGNAIIEEAKLLLKKHGKSLGLRTLDAFHAGAYSLISDENWLFVSSDNNLCSVMEYMGFKTLNPLS